MTFIIAEAGLNHVGDIKLARLLIDKAKWAGADAVKFQAINHIHRLEEYNISYRDFFKLKVCCDDRGIEFMCTPHTFEAIHILNKTVKRHKIASSYMGNANFLMEVADRGKPVMLSTGSLLHDNGMATDEEITKALGWMKKAPKVTLLHCISKYPCVNPHYERIEELKTLCDNVGLSDHSKNIEVPVVPIIEKHLMLDDVDCVDKNVSLNPDEFKQMVDYVRRKE